MESLTEEHARRAELLTRMQTDAQNVRGVALMAAASYCGGIAVARGVGAADVIELAREWEGYIRNG
ncbi:hypothetical protein [Streptomyces sp. SID3212]|uniref:hypothetical protein n=1 Tax=Streptomyces sp. SID3212 TaxID=2690259 RepID=UPI00136A1EB4|nr:hypothetical protein [Streptomyces sp. SID3212]MYV58023.1 hypothetical protein [Streptomyces sp. SID3212]